MFNTDKRLRFSMLSLFILWTTSVYSQINPLLTQEVDDALKNRCLDDEQTAVHIVAVPTGKIVYTYNSFKPLLPASVMKLITTAAALYYLKPEYRFKTIFSHTGRRKNGTIYGDLVVRGGGDPRLSTEQLWFVANQIKTSGIDRFTGNLVIDTHFFDQFDRAPEWELERSQRAYDAKLSSFSLNFNTIAIHVQPGSSAGKQLNAWLEPAPSYIQLHNFGQTVKRGRNTISVDRTEKEFGQVDMWVRGKLPLDVQEQVVHLNVDDPTRYAAETFRQLLAQVGIEIEGGTRIVSTPILGKELYQHFSQPLSLILKELNIYSNNFTAEQIVKTIAAERFGTPGSHAEGLRLIQEFLRIHGVNLQGIVFADGSGLSRKNRLTTKAVTDLLKNMYSRFDIGPDFIAALHIMGTKNFSPDHVSRRLTRSPARGKIRAKTGTLNGVSTLAGYVESQSGKVFGYAVFLNNNRCGAWKADQIEDHIVNAIYKHGGRFLNTAQQ